MAVELYGDMKGKDRTSDSIVEIVPAASVGRVDCLFIPRGVSIWGRFDPDTGDVQMYLDQPPGSQDLLDLAAYHTLANSGRVFLLEPDDMPDATPAAAILRY